MLKSAHRGWSLVELLVAIAAGLLIVLGTTTFFLSSQASVLDRSRSLQLNGIMHSSLEFMGREISRAGYWESAPHFIGSMDRSSPPRPDFGQVNPFGALVLQHYSAGTQGDCGPAGSGSPSCNCLLFAYDHPGLSADSGDLVLTVAPGEFSGYRLNLGQVEYKRSGAAFSCTEGEWAALTPSQLQVTQLEFELGDRPAVAIPDAQALATVGHVSQRSVTIRYSAALAGAADESLTISDRFDIRNDHVSN